MFLLGAEHSIFHLKLQPALLFLGHQLLLLPLEESGFADLAQFVELQVRLSFGEQFFEIGLFDALVIVGKNRSGQRERGKVLQIVVAQIAVVVVVEVEEGHELQVIEWHQAQFATYGPKLLHCQHFWQLQEVSDAVGLLYESLQPPQH